MLDINFIRENIDLVKKAAKSKKVAVDIDELLVLDEKRRGLISQIDELRQQKNQAAAARDIEKGRQIKEELDKLETEFNSGEGRYTDLIIMVPNIPAEDVPEGIDESENVVIRKWGEPREFDFQVKDHVELGELLDIIDIEKASQVTGARFNYLKGEAVMLQFALIQYTFKVLQDTSLLKELALKISPEFSEKSFIPVLPPMMIKPEVYIKMGRLDPSVVDERYHLHRDNLYLIGSAEHSLGPIHMDEMLEEKRLPLRYVGYSSSFRREAGSYGKDTKGILRVHQFDKIEMETFSLPENSLKEQDFIVSIQEYLMQSLNIPYHVVMICTGDMGGPDARQIDIESWIPSQEKYRETHTSDLMTDYQARRLKTRVKRADGSVQMVHMNDATAFAIGRTLVAILENYQQADGSVKIPEVLLPFLNFSEIKPK
jgi:seryl-tRNA synthetase